MPSDRIIDLSIGTAKALGFYGQGLARVRVEYVGRASLAGTDDAALLATLRHGTPAPAPSQRSVWPRADRRQAPPRSDATPMPPERPSAGERRDPRAGRARSADRAGRQRAAGTGRGAPDYVSARAVDGARRQRAPDARPDERPRPLLRQPCTAESRAALPALLSANRTC